MTLTTQGDHDSVGDTPNVLNVRWKVPQLDSGILKPNDPFYGLRGLSADGESLNPYSSGLTISVKVPAELRNLSTTSA